LQGSMVWLRTKAEKRVAIAGRTMGTQSNLQLNDIH
jgi:hypothetical protein